jgi:hypothetical protein
LNTPINRAVPLAPDIAIRIRPDIRLSGTTPDLTFPKFSATARKLKRAEVTSLNPYSQKIETAARAGSYLRPA